MPGSSPLSAGSCDSAGFLWRPLASARCSTTMLLIVKCESFVCKAGLWAATKALNQRQDHEAGLAGTLRRTLDEPYLPLLPLLPFPLLLALTFCSRGLGAARKAHATCSARDLPCWS